MCTKKHNFLLFHTNYTSKGFWCKGIFVGFVKFADYRPDYAAGLGLNTYFTCGVEEVRAWTFKKGMKAPECACVIHTDFEKGFIKAEVISFDDLMSAGGSMVQAKEKGLVRLEGKEYVMNDGDVVVFRFNV